MKFLLLVLFSSCLAASAVGQVSREWIVCDFYSAEFVEPFDVDRHYDSIHAVGDVTGDGGVGVWVQSEEVPPSGVNWIVRYRLLGSPDRKPLFDQEWPDSHFFASSRPARNALLRSPLGVRLGTWTDLDPSALTVWDLSQVSVAALVPPPPPPPSPSPPFYSDNYSAGDVDGDGWDDIFFQTVAYPTAAGYDCVLGLIDGATFAPVWQSRYPYCYTTNWVYSTSSNPSPDLNADGVPDFVGSFSLYDPQVGHFEYLFMALSGVDGSLIWQRRGGPADPSRFSSLGGDFDGDGIVDLFSVAAQDILVLSGADGSVIWSGTTQMLGGLEPPGTQSYWMIGNGFYSYADDRRPAGELCVPTTFLLGQGLREFGVAHLDPASGTLIELSLFPPDLQPWSVDPISGGVWTVPLGDIDRDGLRELAMTVWAPSADNPASAWPDEHLAILSLRTLGVPPTVKLGSMLPVDLSLPGAAGRRFLLLVSDAFDPRGGVVLNGWRTFLAPTPLFAAAFNHPALRGTLSAGGDATLAVPLPGNPALLGRTLYLRAAAEGGPGSIWTLSTLGETEIVP